MTDKEYRLTLFPISKYPISEVILSDPVETVLLLVVPYAVEVQLIGWYLDFPPDHGK